MLADPLPSSSDQNHFDPQFHLIPCLAEHDYVDMPFVLEAVALRLAERFSMMLCLYLDLPRCESCSEGCSAAAGLPVEGNALSRSSNGKHLRAVSFGQPLDRP